MNNHQKLAESVVISKENHQLIHYDDSLQLIGIGRSAYVFRIAQTEKAIKIFFPEFVHLAQEECEIYHSLRHIPYFPAIYAEGENYFVMDYIEGKTLFECISSGIVVEPEHIRQIDEALELAAKQGLNPSDIHLRNILLTKEKEIKLIDVARFRQRKSCRQWKDLKRAYHLAYRKRFFPKKLPERLLNTVAAVYKKQLAVMKA